MTTQTKACASSLALDQNGLNAAGTSLGDGAVIPAYGPHPDAIVTLLSESLATELVGVLRYKRRHFLTSGLASPEIADDVMVHANTESAHADRIAKRIVQLGGEPDFSPNAVLQVSCADYDESSVLKTMVRTNLTAERIAVESYRQMIDLLTDKAPTTRRLLEDIRAGEEAHAVELSD